MRPATIEEAAALLAEASRRRAAASGSATTSRRDGLDRVLEHEAGDLTCTVEAGIRLSALQRDGSPRRGQRLSLDPPGDPTVGACLARRLSGPLSHRFGTPRDLVLGVTLVLGDGTVASSGGKVVKNVAGYDLGKLVCGSEGRLALIARVALRLHPLPGASATLVVETGDPAGVVATLRRSQLQPSALDVLHPGRVAVLFEGRERAVAAQLETARALVGGASRTTRRVGRGARAAGRARSAGCASPRRARERPLDPRRGRRAPGRGHRVRPAPRRRRPVGGRTRGVAARARRSGSTPAGVLA